MAAEAAAAAVAAEATDSDCGKQKANVSLQRSFSLLIWEVLVYN